MNKQTKTIFISHKSWAKMNRKEITLTGIHHFTNHHKQYFKIMIMFMITNQCKQIHYN